MGLKVGQNKRETSRNIYRDTLEQWNDELRELARTRDDASELPPYLLRDTELDHGPIVVERAVVQARGVAVPRGSFAVAYQDGAVELRPVSARDYSLPCGPDLASYLAWWQVA